MSVSTKNLKTITTEKNVLVITQNYRKKKSVETTLRNGIVWFLICINDHYINIIDSINF